MLINSEIRNLITEAFGDNPEDFTAGGAQEINVPFDTNKDATIPPEENVDAAVAAGVGQQGADEALAAAPPGVQVGQGPANIDQSITVDKTLVNTDLIHAILGEIKALVTNAERIFDKEDLESGDAQIYIGNLINSLNTSTEKLVAFVEAPEETPEVTPEAPLPEAPPEVEQ